MLENNETSKTSSQDKLHFNSQRFSPNTQKQQCCDGRFSGIESDIKAISSGQLDTSRADQQVKQKSVNHFLDLLRYL